jgi:uncharacterized Fe-S cluster-containing radical SAM superfamily protein
MTQPYIKFLDIYAGAYCNLACKHCDARSDVIQTKKFDPSLPEILEGISLVRKNFDVVYYGVSGGEPLLYLDKMKKIFEFIRTQDPNATLMFSTNGMLINKNIKQLVDIITNLKVNMFVCDHFSAFEDKTLSNKVKKNVNLLVNALGMKEGSNQTFYKNLFDYKNRKNDKFLQSWLDQKKDIFEHSDPSEKVFYKETFLHFREQGVFIKNYHTINNIPKPLKTRKRIFP